MRVAAVVVSWNSAGQLPACLAALTGQTYPAFEVVVVDNASVDASREVVAAAGGRATPVRLLARDTNRGFCGGVNDALAELADDVEAVLLVNPDVVADRDLVAHCVAALAADPLRGSVQPRLLRPADGLRPAVVDTTGHELTTSRIVRNRGEGGRPDADRTPAGEVFGASGACVLHRRAMLDDVTWPNGEVLTEDLVAYFDDVELDWRSRRRGWCAWYEPAATAVHERGGSGPRRTPWVEALNWSNHLLVTVTCDRIAPRHTPAYLGVGVLKTLELAATSPGGLVAGVRRLPLLVGAVRRRGWLRDRQQRTATEVIEEWARPTPWRAWVRGWWRRRQASSP